MVSAELSERLTDYALRYRRGSANKVAIEILEFYSDAWAIAEEARQAVILQQTGRAGAGLPSLGVFRDTQDDREASVTPKAKRS